ncbi:MAG: polyamine aminopropyltransferase [Verrucomicrobia bacterium]|nr:polyamine aminopropyltransferase [Verrucomicrobiota bacterium]MBU6447010.1 polyamine aminopropyltransferase [Verrucomicrobiota bacterium]MDE3047356.1 polyamine aminopropyltransferase [Verrucomicrobiota bacterium]
MFSYLIATALLTHFQEALFPDWPQAFSVEKVVYQEKTDHWDLLIFENQIFGRVLALDGVVQLTEQDEYAYHEMMVHVPLLAHPNPKSVLIVGGGDGGILREVLRHKDLTRIIEVEIDARIIEMSKKYFPSVSNGAYENPRAKVLIQDAWQYVKETDERFDVIIVDSTDPEGPAKELFSAAFYGDCKKVLKAGGILVNQNGVPFLQKEELKGSYQNRKPHFKEVSFYLTAVPTYTGGFLTIGWASDKKHKVSEKTLAERLSRIEGSMRYYTPAIHKASFTLPQFMLDCIHHK